jgi:hypothetical protein
MANVFETIFNVIFGTISGVTGAISRGIGSLNDFFLVRISGLSFIVLGARQVGKTTLIEWLKHNMDSIEGFEPEPTAAGGDVVPDFTSTMDDMTLKLKPGRDVGGEYAMWETDWIELFREVKPRGIIFVIDHTDSALQKDALNFVMQMIEDEMQASKHLKAFFILVNKSDLWAQTTTLEEIEARFRNEKRRLMNLADRVGFKWALAGGSLHTGRGVRQFIKQFFNTLRPRPQRLSQ